MNKDSAPPALQYSGFTDIDRLTTLLPPTLLSPTLVPPP